MNRRSITSRLLVSYCGLLLVIGALFSFFAIMSFERYTQETIRSNIAVRANEVWELSHGLLDNPRQLAALIEQRFSPTTQDRFIRVSVNGKDIYRSGIPVDRDFDPSHIPTIGVSLAPKLVRYGNLAVYATDFTTQDGRRVMIESGQSDVFARGLVSRLATSVMVGLPMLLIFTAAAGYVLIRRALSPVELMIGAAEQISFNNPRNRLPLMGTGDRIEALGLALNRMLDRLDNAYQHISRFTADAAHELRTPLAIIRGEIELSVSHEGLPSALDTSLNNMLEEAVRLGNIVDSLTTISRMDSPYGKRVHFNVDLLALAAETVDQMHLIAEEKQITLLKPKGEMVCVSGDRDRLKQVLVNLIDNAIKYNVPGGTVVVEVSCGADGAQVAVADTGIGIAAENQSFIFDRFYRVSTDRGEIGAGLGLAIVKSICHAHGGTIDVDSKLGSGTRFRVSLPMRTPETVGLVRSYQAGLSNSDSIANENSAGLPQA